MSYETIVEDYKNFMLSDPIFATDMGVHDRDHEFSKLTSQQISKEVEDAKLILADLSSLDKSDLNPDQIIDLELVELNLNKEIFQRTLRYNDLYDYEQKPQAGEYLISAFLYLFLKDPRDPKVRLDAINSRINKIPVFFDEYKLTLKKTIDRWKDIEIEELEGMSDLFENMYDWAKSINYSNLDDMHKNIDVAKQSILDYLDYLKSIDVLNDYSIGRENAQKLVALNGIDLTLDEIYNVSKSFFKSHQIKINELVEDIKVKYNLDSSKTYEDVMEFIKDKFSVPVKSVVDEYKKNHEEVMEYLKHNDYFVYPKSDELLILQTPSYLIPSIPVGAMFPPAQFEEGPKKSLIYLTVDEGRQKDQNSLMITNTMIHEGIPGHHLQFSVAYEVDSVVRKLGDYRTHAEGWTTYMEQFMTDVGFVDEKILDEYKLIALSDLARLGARVAIDLFFMTNDEKYLNVIGDFVPEGETAIDKAKSLLQKATKFTSARADGELNWYSKCRGVPMCYLLGNILVNQLQKDVLAKFDDKEEGLKVFHKTYLKEGVMPLSFLRKVFEHKGIL